MKLYLAAPDREQIIIRLFDGDNIIDQIEEETGDRQAENFLPAIDGFLRRNQVTLGDIKQIIINNKGKSFSALRLAVGVANALAYAAGIPLQAENGEVIVSDNYQLAVPVYDREPNITEAKN